MSSDYELSATSTINAHRAKGHEPLTVEECKLHYGTAFDALVSLLSKRTEA